MNNDLSGYSFEIIVNQLKMSQEYSSHNLSKYHLEIQFLLEKCPRIAIFHIIPFSTWKQGSKYLVLKPQHLFYCFWVNKLHKNHFKCFLLQFLVNSPGYHGNKLICVFF